jgi:cell division protein FtsW (lipid II flippase)
LNRFWTQLSIATNWPVLAALALLSSLGAVSIYVSDKADGQKQLLFLGIAVGCLIGFQVVNYRIIGRWVWAFYAFSLLLVLYTDAGHLIHGLPLVHNIRGVFAWINIGPLSLEPSELAKISFVLVVARYLRYRSNYRAVSGLLAPFGIALLPILLILVQPDLGVAALFLPTLMIMLFVAGAKLRHMFSIVGLGVAFVPIFWFSGMPTMPVFRHFPALMQKYQRDRVYTMLFGNSAGNSAGDYQVHHGLMAIGTGGWFGKGPGHIPVGMHVPENHDDMVFALIGEQFGLLGTVAVIGAFLVFCGTGIVISSKTKEPFGRLIAVGIVAEIACQATINLSVCLRLIPVTGVTLPFVSYGGSSLIASYMAAGILLNVGQNRPITFAKEAFEFDGAD